MFRQFLLIDILIVDGCDWPHQKVRQAQNVKLKRYFGFSFFKESYDGLKFCEKGDIRFYHFFPIFENKLLILLKFLKIINYNACKFTKP